MVHLRCPVARRRRSLATGRFGAAIDAAVFGKVPVPLWFLVVQ